MKYRLCLILGLFLSLRCAVAVAAPVTLEYALGFDGYFRLQTWTPLTILLDNRGRPINGTLDVVVTSGNEYLQTIQQTTYAQDVDVPANAQKACAFTVLLTSFTHDLRIRFRQGDQEVLSLTIPLRSGYTLKPLALVVDEKTSPDFLAVLPETLLPVNVRPKFLPETWYGYEGVELLVISPAMLAALKEQQFQALADWLAGGGNLVIAGGLNYGALLEHRTRQLLPIKILGTRAISAIPALQTFGGHALQSAAPFLVLHSQIEQAEVLVQEQDLPMVTAKPVGDGKIFWLAFDIQAAPFSRWEHRRAFWQHLFARRAMRAASPVTLKAQTLLKTLTAAMPVEFPNWRWVFASFGAYLILLQMLFAWNRALPPDRRWRVLLGLIGATLSATLAIYLIFGYPLQQPTLRSNSVLLLNKTDSQTIATGSAFFGLYAVQASAYELDLVAPVAPVTHLTRAPSPQTPAYALVNTPRGQRLRGQAAPWSAQYFALAARLSMPLTAQAQSDAQGVHLKISNPTAYQLEACWGYLDQRVFWLGAIRPGEQQTRTIPFADMLPAEGERFPFAAVLTQAENAPLSNRLREMQKELTKQLFMGMTTTSQPAVNSLALVARVTADPILLDWAARAGLNERLTLFTWEIPVARRSADVVVR